MIELKMITTREDLRKITGLPSDNHDKALWDAGFNLDDWDVCFVSDVELDWDNAGWLMCQMDAYCCGAEHTAYNGKHYYMVYHS